ncbi:hypothetical protein BS78_08G036700 [Paspalum vaginatum]|uniref:Cystatin domain-containing protein n=1 Tax=Paspalum vaginatum TaxID=158149 RepID=A0A9W7XAZ0_9POAL|nr:hypothetical protein BS78_K273500 [Paspalum vaginatum]KAJ1264893.1 hypothetical protein BS78_08G036700 [Paspalum vaginatum]
MRTFHAVIAVATAALLCAAASPATADDRYLCNWRTVAHPEDPFIQSLGKWAVEQNGVPMRFDKVESAKAQCVDDIISKTRNYELIIVAATRDDEAPGRFRAVVYVENFTQPKKLVSFERITRPRLDN